MSTHSPLISSLIVDRPMCITCLAARTRMQTTAVETALEVLGRALVIRRHPGTSCTECGATTTVYVLDVR